MANMELSKYIKSESVELNRSAIHFADYKPISGYNGKYIISQSGDIVRLPYSSNSKYTQWRNNKMFHVKSRIDRNGYVTVRLNINGVEKVKQLHRLVAETFLSKIDGKDFVNHKDGNKSNNNVSNLEWCTKSENTYHAYKTGLKEARKGGEVYNSSLTNQQAKIIRERALSGESCKSLSKEFNVPVYTISKIKTGTSYKNV